MVKKMSPTKQIEAMLDTPDKTKQVERIQQLIQVADLPGVAVTVLYSHGQIRLGFAGTTNLNSQQAKGILQMAIDQLTRQEVMSEVEKEAQNAMGGPGPLDGIPADIPAGETGSEDGEVHNDPVDGKI